MFNIMIDIRYISRCVIHISKSVRFILHVLSSDYSFSSVHVKNLSPTPPKKTRGPDVAVSVSRLIFMRCHNNVQSDTPQSSPECRTDSTIRAGNRIYNKCHTTPSSTTCFKPSDHLMYNLNNLNRGASIAEHSSSETNRQPGTRSHTRNPKNCMNRYIYYIYKDTIMKKKRIISKIRKLQLQNCQK